MRVVRISVLPHLQLPTVFVPTPAVNYFAQKVVLFDPRPARLPLLYCCAVQPVALIAQGYPRGSKQLIGPFKSLFGPRDAAVWFGSRGVRLKTEGDGRMFPVTDDSQTIIDCLEGRHIRVASVREHMRGVLLIPPDA